MKRCGLCDSMKCPRCGIETTYNLDGRPCHKCEVDIDAQYRAECEAEAAEAAEAERYAEIDAQQEYGG